MEDLASKLNKLKLKPARRTAQRARSAEIQQQRHDALYMEHMQTQMDVNEPPKKVQHQRVFDTEPRVAGRSREEDYHPCSLCGRTFHIDALKRHAAICERVFQRQRKPFDSGMQRRVTDGSFDSMRSVGGTTTTTTKKMSSGSSRLSLQKSRRKPSQSMHTMSRDEIPVGPRATKPTPSGKNWRKKSGQLRAALAAMREPSKAAAPRRSRYTLSDMNEQDAFRTGINDDDDDRIQCPYCSRKFSETAAARHIPFCRTQHQRRLITGAGSKGSGKKRSGGGLRGSRL